MRNQVEKYLTRDKTVVTKLTSKDHLKLPLISFCPGFRRDVARETRWLLTKYDKDYYHIL